MSRSISFSLDVKRNHSRLSFPEMSEASLISTQLSHISTALLTRGTSARGSNGFGM